MLLSFGFNLSAFVFALKGGVSLSKSQPSNPVLSKNSRLVVDQGLSVFLGIFMANAI